VLDARPGRVAVEERHVVPGRVAVEERHVVPERVAAEEQHVVPERVAAAVLHALPGQAGAQAPRAAELARAGEAVRRVALEPAPVAAEERRVAWEQQMGPVSPQLASAQAGSVPGPAPLAGTPESCSAELVEQLELRRAELPVVADASGRLAKSEPEHDSSWRSGGPARPSAARHDLPPRIGRDSWLPAGFARSAPGPAATAARSAPPAQPESGEPARRRCRRCS
jgi:hypothetical protein